MDPQELGLGSYAKLSVSQGECQAVQSIDIIAQLKPTSHQMRRHKPRGGWPSRTVFQNE